jgi:hypothetical protein
MYNINNHYRFIFDHIKNKIKEPKVLFFYPFGSTNYKNIEYIGNHNIDANFLCFDQEPLNFRYNFETFKSFNQHIRNNFDKIITFIQASDKRGYSKILKHNINLINPPCHNDLIEITPTILLNTEKDSEEKNKIIKHFNLIDCYYFFHGLAATDWFRGYEFCSAIVPVKERIISKKFISFNRITGNSRIYRAFLIGELYKKQLINFGHISFSKNCPVHGNLNSSILETVKKYQIDTNYVSKMFKVIEKIPEFRIDTSIENKIENQSFTIGAISECMESFLHVVTETCFWDSKKHLTEKIFKPIVLKQPFVLLGCANNLAYLKEYGFRTFDKWWSEDYDNCTDPVERILMVVNIIEKISKLPNNELQNMLIEMEEVLEHNFNRFYSKEFVKDVWNELEVNLTSAIAQLPLQTELKN